MEKLCATRVRAMTLRLLVVLCLIGFASITASAGNITFSGSGTTGTSALGLSFSYDFFGPFVEANWGMPGVSAGGDIWPSGYGELTSFEITFSFPVVTGVSTAIDPAQILVGNGAHCIGGATGGTAFCSEEHFATWTADLISPDTIEFLATPGNAVVPGEEFFVNIFFSGTDPSGASFSGSLGTSATPEPSSLLLLGTGLLGIGPLVRRFAHL